MSSKTSCSAVMEMDADFSHKPEDVPRLIKELDTNDFVIGSRYVPGGKIPDTWNLLRKLNSWGGNICARYIAGVYHVRDCTAGFRAIKADLLRKINLPQINAEGYCFQVSLLHEAVVNKVKIKEIPVEFVDRREGISKLGFMDIIEFIFLVWIIRLENSKTFIKFAIVGVSGLFVNLGSMTLLLHFDVNKFIASPISIELSIISNFLLNNYWTFVHRKTEDKLRIKGLKFNIISFLSLAISYSTFVFIILIFPNMMPQVAQAIGIVPAMLVNYFFNSYWTFKNSNQNK